MSRYCVPRRQNNDAVIRHISEVLPRVLSNYISRDDPKQRRRRMPRQLNLFDDLILSIGSSRQQGA